MSRKGDYLFKRKGSANWWLRLQNTSVNGVFHKKYECSLKTPDRDLALIRANERILEH